MKKELKPFFTKKNISVKTQDKTPQQKLINMNGFERLIGKNCDYSGLKCEIQSFDYITEDKWPYNAYVTVSLNPCNWKEVDENTLSDMQDGVSLGEISGIDE